jgi:7,8-dihydropterin-6-yl-methyl-4-(beta-D-ribofuranosyl)aminobenzene 5'-phosphate synthase
LPVRLQHCRRSSPKRITILYDVFGARAQQLEMDWGFVALIEYGGRRVLFDTGNNARIFEHNERLGVDFRNRDAVIISHRQGDHTSGLNYLLQVNPAVHGDGRLSSGANPPGLKSTEWPPCFTMS